MNVSKNDVQFINTIALASENVNNKIGRAHV